MPDHIRDGRIVPEKVAALWAKWGVEPEPETYVGYRAFGQPCGCLTGILLVEACRGIVAACGMLRGLDSNKAIQAMAANVVGLDPAYMTQLDHEFSFLRTGDGGEVARLLCVKKRCCYGDDRSANLEDTHA